jgi:DNA-directed RNA polymerase alpha subunit
MTSREKVELWVDTLLKCYIKDGRSEYDMKSLMNFIGDVSSDKRLSKEFLELFYARLSTMIGEYSKTVEDELDTRIQDTDLPAGLKQTLLLAGKKTMRDVIKLPKSFVSSFRNIGQKKIEELEKWFRNRELPWK